MFVSKEEIGLMFPKLKKFTLFREAMPFFDNNKYKLEIDELNELIFLLNSDLEYKNIMKNIKDLQNKKI